MKQGLNTFVVLAYLVVEEIEMMHMLCAFVITVFLLKRRSQKRARSGRGLHYSLLGRMPEQVRHLNRLVHVDDAACLSNLRMDRNTFGKLCFILKGAGLLSDSKYVPVEAQVAMFVGCLAHHKKNRVIGFDFMRSGETVHHYIHAVLIAILKLYRVFLFKATPIKEDCEDPRWRDFQGCVGALDGTYLQVTVPSQDKPRFRSRKGQICTNTLACCDTKMRFTYVLPGWEGSAADSRILRDAVSRPSGLKVPKDCYFLCDNGYANCPGFLTPMKEVRYHLKEWGPESGNPTTPAELYNLRHTKARNVIERAFAVLKMRWGVLRSPSFYPLKIQIRMIMCCFLLHNFIRSEMMEDPVEMMLDGAMEGDLLEHSSEEAANDEYIEQVDGCDDWNSFRDGLANTMWNQYNM